MNLENYDYVDPHLYANKLQIIARNPKVIKLPKYIQKLIFSKKILDISNQNDCAKIFIQTLYLQNIRSSTISKYFHIIKPLLFPDTTIIPNSMVFDRNTVAQSRGIGFDKIDKLIEYTKETQSIYKWPILLAFHTGLRLSEISQFRASHILMLLDHENKIPINRKNNLEWTVVYYEEFNNFIHHLRNNVYQENCNFFISNKVDTLLFDVSSQTLHYKIKEFYSLANNGEISPKGFGFHIFRYYIGSKLISENKLDIAQIFLGHKSIKTTERYIKYDNSMHLKKIEQINKNSKFYKDINTTLELLHKKPILKI
uniref:Tyr recombinase domain-containing protein n=1 Tax=Faxonius propinquus nudivirus TaxID=3139431 RepID=A0AAU8GFJ5_9VIRU